MPLKIHQTKTYFVQFSQVFFHSKIQLPKGKQTVAVFLGEPPCLSEVPNVCPHRISIDSQLGLTRWWSFLGFWGVLHCPNHFLFFLFRYFFVFDILLSVFFWLLVFRCFFSFLSSVLGKVGVKTEDFFSPWFYCKVGVKTEGFFWVRFFNRSPVVWMFFVYYYYYYF